MNIPIAPVPERFIVPRFTALERCPPLLYVANIAILFSPVTLITPPAAFSTSPIYCVGLLAIGSSSSCLLHEYPPAIATEYFLFSGSDFPTVIVPAFVIFPVLPVAYAPIFPTPCEKSIVPLFTAVPLVYRP